MRVFVDFLVLADVEAGCVAALGMGSRQYVELHGARLFWKALERRPEFFARLAAREDGLRLWGGISGRVPPPFVHAELPGAWAEPQVRAWVRGHLPAAQMAVVQTVWRATYAAPGDVLVSVDVAARLDWESAGGVFVEHLGAAETLETLAELDEPPPNGGKPEKPPKGGPRRTPNGSPVARYRSKRTGEFVSRAYAEENPQATFRVKERA